MFNILANAACGELEPVIIFVKGVLNLIQFAVPILLIVMGTIDLGKAVLSSDDKEIKAATGKLVKRAIAAVAVFFITAIVSVVMGLVDVPSVGGDNNFNWKACWTGKR